MGGPITVLWLVDRDDLPVQKDERFRHVVGDPRVPAATIVGLLAEGAVLAVVRDEQEGRNAIAYGADEVILAEEASGPAFEKVVERTASRARARLHRDLFLIDMVRRDDTSALALFAAALGKEIADPLARVAQAGGKLASQLGDEGERAERLRMIEDTVSEVNRVVARMQQLVGSEPTDELVDLCEVVRGVSRALEPGVRPLASFELQVVDRPCLVSMPRWQVAMMVGSLIANSVESIAALRGGERHVRVGVTVHDGSALLQVSDDGAGMDEETRAYASDPFFTTGGTGQHGLGLTLVSARVRRAGGVLMIESDEGVGTTVRVFLPLVGEPPKASPAN